MADRKTFLYRLVVVYPEGSKGAPHFRTAPGWEPDGWDDLAFAEIEARYGKLSLEAAREWECPPFTWPLLPSAYRSRSGAAGMAKRLESYGATVTVVRSEPVVWPEETNA